MNLLEKVAAVIEMLRVATRAERPHRRDRRARREALLRLALGAAMLGGGVEPACAQCDPQEITKLLDAGGAASDNFGWSVAVSADTAVVGVVYDDNPGDGSGSAIVFERIGGLWTPTVKLAASDGAPFDTFGNSVSISDDTIVVGAIQDDDNGDDSGSAYVFEKIDGAWTETAKLIASDGAKGEQFGIAVSISADLIVVGASRDDVNGLNSGSAYVFERIGGDWVEMPKLTPMDGTAGHFFGEPVFISGDVIIAGARGDNGGAGAAYVFEIVGDEWSQVKLTASDGADLDRFGYAVTVSGDAAVVGARHDDDDGNDSGSAYVFERTEGVWMEKAKLTASDAQADALFGWSVVIEGDTAVIGAMTDDAVADRSGSAYVFVRNAGAWTEAAKITAADGMHDDLFGRSVALSDDILFVGATGDDDNGSLSGSAYVYDLNCACRADVNGDGNLNILDFVAFQLLWQDGDPNADCDDNGAFNVLDFVCFQQLFQAGCDS